MAPLLPLNSMYFGITVCQPHGVGNGSHSHVPLALSPHRGYIEPMASVRPTAVAGLFYPGSEAELRPMVEALLREVPEQDGPAPKAVIAPHAGYVYSGPIAASAFRALSPAAGAIRRVIL